MNVAMWRKALPMIPEVSKSEGDELDVISRRLLMAPASNNIFNRVVPFTAGLIRAS